MAGIRLVSVNIERSKHLDRVIPFLQSEQPDVVCIQELNERDIPIIVRELGGAVVFTPLGNAQADAPEEGILLQGLGIWSKKPLESHAVQYYVGSETIARNSPVLRLLPTHAVAVAEIECDGEMYRIATTHFTWTPDGSASDEQRVNRTLMLAVLSAYDHFVLTGDFNAPRGGEIFTSIAARYVDNIPAGYTSSIDGSLHRAGQLDLMVDGLFSTPEYAVSGVRLQDGVSDHMAVVAHIEKRPNT